MPSFSCEYQGKPQTYLQLNFKHISFFSSILEEIYVVTTSASFVTLINRSVQQNKTSVLSQEIYQFKSCVPENINLYKH